MNNFFGLEVKRDERDMNINLPEVLHPEDFEDAWNVHRSVSLKNLHLKFEQSLKLESREYRD